MLPTMQSEDSEEATPLTLKVEYTIN